jgi:hypothetical protein
MEEIWKEVPGYEGYYWVSNFGNVKSVPRQGSRGGIMTGRIDKKGYKDFTFRKDGK